MLEQIAGQENFHGTNAYHKIGMGMAGVLTDGNGNILKKVRIQYTDFPALEQVVWVERTYVSGKWMLCLMLQGER